MTFVVSIIAAVTRFQQAFNADDSAMQRQRVVVLCLLLLGLVFATVAGYVLAQRLHRDLVEGGPTIRGFGRSLGLTSHDIRLLRELARRTGGMHPVSLMLSRGCFEYAASHARAAGFSAEDLRRIRTTIFDG